MDSLNRFEFRLLVLAAAVAFLTSCGGGGTTAGAGGSGIGGTGITATVNGNVVQVVAKGATPDSGHMSVRMLAAVMNFLAERVNAQSGGVEGIRVQGGGREAVTDSMGRFTLNEVPPSEDFQMVLTLQDTQRVVFSIGQVPAGSTVNVSNIVVNKSRGDATPSSVEVELDDDASSNGDADDPSAEDGVSREQPRDGTDDDSEDDDDSEEDPDK